MNKKKTALVVAFIVMGVAVLGLAAAVYAKYIASLTGNTATMTVAKWAFDTDNSSGVVTCPITTYNTQKLSEGKIAPGTSGECTISLSNATSEVGVDYTIKLSSIADQPDNLKFYKTKTTGNDGDEYSNELTVSGGSITGFIAAKTAGPVTETIYWVWPYETGTPVDGIAPGDTDENDSTVDDTAAGKAAQTLTITFDSTGVQAQPTTN